MNLQAHSIDVAAPALPAEAATSKRSREALSLRRDSLYRRSLAASDVLSAELATVLAVSVVGGARMTPLAIVLLPLVVLVGKLLGLYDRDENLVRKTTLDEVPVLFQSTMLYTLLVWLFEGPLVAGSLDRWDIVALLVLLFTLLTIGRTVARRLVRAAVPPERCLVVGDETAAARLTRKLETAPALNAAAVGSMPLGDGRGSLNGDLQALSLAVAERAVDRVIIAPDASDSEQILDAIRLVKALGVKVSVLPRLLEVVGSSVEFDYIDGVTLLGVRQYGLTTSSSFVKRCVDVCGAGLGLLLLSPLLSVIALAVKVSSRGPVFFRQRRVGRDGRQFQMLKFRTMVDGADEQKAAIRGMNEADGLFKITDDPRMTAVGRFLRRTSLDELPQLFNVLCGDMSLVGPRPLILEEDRQIEGWHRSRLEVAPGMTGYWQIAGSARLPLSEMVTIDYLYAANWSLWGDVKILLRTVPYVLGRRGL